MSASDLSAHAGNLLDILLRARTPLPGPVRAEAAAIATRTGGTRSALLHRSDCAPVEDRCAPHLPEGIAARLGRTGVTAEDIVAAFDAAGRIPRLLGALCRSVSPFRSPAYVPTVTSLCVQVGGYEQLATLATRLELTTAERVHTVLAVDRALAARGAPTSGGWAETFLDTVAELLAHDLATARAIFAQVTSPALLGCLSPAALPTDADVQQRICDTLLACARTEQSSSPHGISAAAAADTLTRLLPAAAPAVATRIRDAVLTGVRWPPALRMGQFLRSVPHAEPASIATVTAIPWQRLTVLPDPYLQLADAVAGTLSAHLGDDPDAWTLLVRCGVGFTGTLGELLDVVPGIAAPPG